MRLSRIPNDLSVFDVGKSISIKGGRRAILLLHGWTGWPGRLVHLADRLGNAGYTVSVPRLPGHGTAMKDMLETDAEDWLRRAVDAYVELRQDHDVRIAGTSMGGILTTLLAAHFGVDRIALLAPAHQTRNRLLWLAPISRHFVKRIRGDWSSDEELDPAVLPIGEEYARYNHLATVAELYRLQRMGRADLKHLRSDTLVIVSRRDEAIPETVADYLERRAPNARFERLVLERSNHQIADHIERDAACDAVVEWFSRW